MCRAERRRRRLLGLERVRAAGDGRHDGQADTDGGDGAWVRLDVSYIVDLTMYNATCNFDTKVYRSCFSVHLRIANNGNVNYFLRSIVILYKVLFPRYCFPERR